MNPEKIEGEGKKPNLSPERGTRAVGKPKRRAEFSGARHGAEDPREGKQTDLLDSLLLQRAEPLK